jgi:PAS domain S-box-containing protein
MQPQREQEQLQQELEALRRRVAELEGTAELCADEGNGAESANDRFRKIFDHSNDAIFLVDPLADEIIDCNHKACGLLGYTRDELLSVPLSVVHPYEMKQLQAFVQDVFEQGRGWTNELTCMTKSHAVLEAELSASVVEIDGKRLMIALVRDVSDRERLARENAYLNAELREEGRFGSIIGESAVIKDLLSEVEVVAPTDASVLISGGSGTGKELFARAIHERSARANRPLVRVNCAAVPSELFESEFFGHVKGAFTGAVRDRVGRFQLADGGTLFLDEVGEIPLPLQGKLLRVLQEGQFERVGEARTREVDVRLVAATNRCLAQEVEDGRFREDLYYRVNVFPLAIPPLSMRSEDIAPLALHFIEHACERFHLPQASMSMSQRRALERYSWPGNVRELQNVVERAVIVARGGPLQFTLGSQQSTGSYPTVAPGPPPADQLTLDDLKQLEREVIVHALEQTQWKIYGDDGAAARLGLPPTTLASKIKKLGLERPMPQHQAPGQQTANP